MRGLQSLMGPPGQRGERRVNESALMSCYWDVRPMYKCDERNVTWLRCVPSKFPCISLTRALSTFCVLCWGHHSQFIMGIEVQYKNRKCIAMWLHIVDRRHVAANALHHLDCRGGHVLTWSRHALHQQYTCLSHLQFTAVFVWFQALILTCKELKGPSAQWGLREFNVKPRNTVVSSQAKTSTVDKREVTNPTSYFSRLLHYKYTGIYNIYDNLNTLIFHSWHWNLPVENTFRWQILL